MSKSRKYLTQEQAQEAKRLVLECEMTRKEVADLFEVNASVISRVVSENWKPLPSLSERLESGLETHADGCMTWTGSTDDFGYGWIRNGQSMDRTHRVAWTLVNGPITDGLCVLHKCDNPPCCNPEHLFLGTREDNNQDRHHKGRSSSGPRHSKAISDWHKSRKFPTS